MAADGDGTLQGSRLQRCRKDTTVSVKAELHFWCDTPASVSREWLQWTRGRPWWASSSVRLLDAVLRQGPNRKLALHAQILQLLAPLCPLLHQFQTEFHPQSRHLHLQLRRTHRLQIYPVHRRGEGALRRHFAPLWVERRLLAAHGRDWFLGVGKWE